MTSPHKKEHPTGLRKHSRLLTFIGALIVFTTFIVKEGMREHLKSVGDSLEIGDYMFALREDNARTYSTLLNVVDATTLSDLKGKEAERVVAGIENMVTMEQLLVIEQTRSYRGVVEAHQEVDGSVAP
jgi:hypothetical protein